MATKVDKSVTGKMLTRRILNNLSLQELINLVKNSVKIPAGIPSDLLSFLVGCYDNKNPFNPVYWGEKEKDIILAKFKDKINLITVLENLSKRINKTYTYDKKGDTILIELYLDLKKAIKNELDSGKYVYVTLDPGFAQVDFQSAGDCSVYIIDAVARSNDIDFMSFGDRTKIPTVTPALKFYMRNTAAGDIISITLVALITSWLIGIQNISNTLKLADFVAYVKNSGVFK